jgi:putative tricarboxylic transport membrane protein
MMDIRDIISCIVCLSIAVFIFATSLHLGVGTLHNPGPGFILFWAGIFLAVCTCILFGISISKKKGPLHWPDLGSSGNSAGRIIVMAALTGYCLLLTRLGYIISTFALMLVLFSLGRMKPWMIILASLITVLFSYYLFDHLLETPLPKGVLSF